MPIKLVTGLGNPGTEYARTPHNVGFRVADRIAERCSATWRAESRFTGLVAKAKWNGMDILLLKPQTFRNLSGESVGRLARYYNVAPADLVVVSDDADLPVGRLRVRPEGGTGGHRGLQSITEVLGTKAFARVRVGIGRPSHGGELAAHVLGRLGPEEEEVLRRAEDAAAEAALCVLSRGVDEAMNTFNAEGATVAPTEDRQG